MMNSSRENKKIRFTVSEKRGIFIFITLILLFLGIRLLINHFVQPSVNTDHSEFSDQIAEYEKGILLEEEKRKKAYFDLFNPNRSFVSSKLTPFEFDPNIITKEGLKALGLTDKQANTIENYKLKGGIFQKKEDFKKMYCISDTEYEILAPYIQISATTESSTKFPSKTYSDYSAKASLIFELNEVDTLDLQELRGIGPVLSKRIVAYRNKLGGFHTIDQLLEVKGITQELVHSIEKSLIIDPEKISKINLNTSSFYEIKNHPYLDYHQAKAILKYREEIKHFDNLNELLNVNLIYKETLEKIEPYFTVE